MVIGKGKSFSTTTYATISLISEDSLQYPVLPKKKVVWKPRLQYDTDFDRSHIDLPKDTFGIMKITQGSNTIIRK
jgi:hypothetical protein